jgi:SAM-dependent methyltransferase
MSENVPRSLRQASIAWDEFLTDLVGRHPTVVAFAYQWWEYNAPQAAHIRAVVPPPAKILEVGTGTGANAVFLAAQGYDVVAVDSSPEVLESAARLAKYFRVPCRFELADGFDLSPYYGSFDLVFSSGVIEHFSPEEAVRFLREQSKAGTSVLVTVPTWHALRHDPRYDPSTARSIRLRELRRLCREAGMTVARCFAFGIPEDRFATVYRYFLPGAVQWLVQTRFGYACTIGCVCRNGLSGSPSRQTSRGTFA